MLLSLLASLSFFAANSLLPLIIKLAKKWGYLDEPNERKVHKNPTPRLGGIGIAPAIWLGCAASLLIGDFYVSSEWAGIFSRAITGLLLGASGMFFLGLIDDLRHLRASQKLAVQIVIASFCVYFLPIPESTLTIAASADVTRILIAAWLILIPNAVNLLDGVDGLTGTLVGLFLTAISLMACLTGQFAWLFITVPAIAASLGFLRFNWAPAKVFLGDSGSLSLGFLVAYLSLYFSLQGAPSTGLEWNPFIGVLLTLIWVLDTSFAILRRYFGHMPTLKILWRKSVTTYLSFHGFAFKKIWAPDQNHIHHRLKKAGLKSPQIVALLSLISFGGMIWSVLFVGAESSFLSSALQIIVLSAIFGGLGVVFLSLCFRALLDQPSPEVLSEQSSDRAA